MSEERKPVVTSNPFGALREIVQTLRLTWRLMQDPRVPIFAKLIIPAAIVYVFSPIDLLPDFILGLGQLDDIGVLILSITFFIDLCPPDIVAEHRRALTISHAPPGPSPHDVVEGNYQILKDDDPKGDF